MRYILILALLFTMTGCESLRKKKQVIPPSVSTTQVIDALTDTKQELVKAGEANTKVAKNVETALTLAQRLEILLEQIEREQKAKE
jgi:ABC-type uncharacterized transport system auxiliary subunit